MLTRTQFLAQFPIPIDVSSIAHLLKLETTFEGVPVYRCLNLLFVKVDGVFYASDHKQEQERPS